MCRLWTTPEDAVVATRGKGRLIAVASSMGVVATATLACFVLFRERLPDIVMSYLLGVVVMASHFGYWSSLLTALLSVAFFDFFFTLPYYSFVDIDERYVATYAMFILIALVVSHFTERIRNESRLAIRNERATQHLYELSNRLSPAASVLDVVAAARADLRDTFGGEPWIVLSGPSGAESVGGEPASGLDAAIRHRAMEALAGRDVPAVRLADRTAEYMVPLRVSQQVIGILVMLPPARARAIADEAAIHLLGAFAGQIALALERVRLTREAKLAHSEALEQERLRNALLSSVSHDLRTPLALVKGAATALLEEGAAQSPTRRREYLETISEQSTGLNRLLGNLINMTSLEAGMMKARKESVPTEEVIGAALTCVESGLSDRHVTVHIAADATTVGIDPVLFQQVLVNLLENAIKHTPAGTAIEIGARRSNRSIEIEIADHGPGVPAGEEERIFARFQRGSGSTDGMGLGLTICRGIAAVHGGAIRCENSPGGGARFVVTLPELGDGTQSKAHGSAQALEGAEESIPYPRAVPTDD